MSELRVESDWPATAVLAADGEMTLTFTAPCCNTAYQLNLQPPAKRQPVSSELWCHRDGQGAAVTVRLV